MEPITLLQMVRHRIPWTTMRPALQSLNLPLGHGWDGTIVKIMAAFTKDPSLSDRIIPAIKQQFTEHLYCGEKLLKIYRVDERVLHDLADKFLSMTVAKSTFSDTYPWPLPEEELGKLSDSPELVSVENSAGKVKLVFCSSRHYEEQITLHADDLKEDVLTELDLPDQMEIIAKRKNFRQFYDVMVFNLQENILELRFDWGVGVNMKEAAAAILKVRRKFVDISSQLLGYEFHLETPINVFPLVKKLYEDGSVGRVCELGFTVNSGSVKAEKLRRFSSDIRSEEFHKGGREAVDGQIAPYRIAIDWSEMPDMKLVTRPELDLRGTQKNLSKPRDNQLTKSLILSCYRQSEFDYIVKIMCDRLEKSGN